VRLVASQMMASVTWGRKNAPANASQWRPGAWLLRAQRLCKNKIAGRVALFCGTGLWTSCTRLKTKAIEQSIFD